MNEKETLATGAPAGSPIAPCWRPRFVRMSAAAARRAAVYRLLATGPLPSARDASEALRQPHAAKVTMEEMAVLLQSCVDEGDPAEDACVTECLRRLREAGDGLR